MIEVIRRRGVEAPPERVWLLVDEPAELARWFTFAESIELIDGQGLGRRQKLHGRWGIARSLDVLAKLATKRKSGSGTRPEFGYFRHGRPHGGVLHPNETAGIGD
jgi:hypothetical protein